MSGREFIFFGISLVFCLEYFFFCFSSLFFVYSFGSSSPSRYSERANYNDSREKKQITTLYWNNNSLTNKRASKGPTDRPTDERRNNQMWTLALTAAVQTNDCSVTLEKRKCTLIADGIPSTGHYM